MYRHILLAADGSKHSERAADHAIHLASMSNEAVVDMIYVLDYARANMKSCIAKPYRTRTRTAQQAAVDRNKLNRRPFPIK
ncbi:universal stress protein [Bacillus licheniformis]|nr:universal stress protein [Bacillus licheniformis]